MESTLEWNHPRANERTTCVRNTDCLLNQIRFIIFSHAAKIGIFYLMAKRAVISYLNLMTRYCSVAAVPILTLLCA